MKKTTKLIAFIFLLICFSSHGHAQFKEAIKISSLVGNSIDSTENAKHFIFLEYSFDEFELAQIFKHPNGKLELLVYLKNKQAVSRFIDKYELQSLRRKIIEHLNQFQTDTDTTYQVILKDGSGINGRILELNNKHVVMHSEAAGELNIATENILRILLPEENEEIINPGENPHYSRYFFGPSAIPLEKGEGYFQDIYLVFISGNYAFTDNLLLGAGFSILPGVGIDEQMFFFNSKIATPISENVYIGGGILFASVIEENMGIIYGVGTYGDKQHNATIGLGYGYINGQLARYPIITISGMTKISKRISLITENWILSFENEEYENGQWRTKPESIGIISYGARFFGSRIAVDLGFMNIVGVEAEFFFPGIPYLDFVLRF